MDDLGLNHVHESQANNNAERAQRKLTIRILVPLLLGFIPFVIILPALGISGKPAATVLLVYFVVYLIVQFLLLRRSMKSNLRRLKTSQIASTVPLGMLNREKETEAITRPKVVDETDLELCPHCGSAVSRKSQDRCPNCGKSLA